MRPPPGGSVAVRRAARAAAGAFAATLVLAALAAARAQSHALPALSAAVVIDRVIHRDARLTASSCSLSIRFRESGFPHLSKTINGTAYFAKGRFAAVFTDVPSILNGFPNAYKAMMNVSGWHRGFVITLDAQQAQAGHTDYVLHLAARDPKSTLQYGRAFVNPKTWMIEAMDWHFKGMQFAITQTFGPLGPYLVLKKQQATIRVPIARAGATATFANYRLNVVVSPAIFGPDP